jgi:hypothetical protein
MIIWDKKNGYTYEDETNGKRYGLFEAKCYQGEASSDIVIIWDEEKNQFANYVYGADSLFGHIEELDNTIKYYVGEATKATPKAEVTYRFTKAGVKAFLADASTEFFEDMDNGGEHLDQFDIVVSCGKRSIRVPLGAEEWNALEDWLTECVEEYE